MSTYLTPEDIDNILKEAKEIQSKDFPYLRNESFEGYVMWHLGTMLIIESDEIYEEEKKRQEERDAIAKSKYEEFMKKYPDQQISLRQFYCALAWKNKKENDPNFYKLFDIHKFDKDSSSGSQ